MLLKVELPAKCSSKFFLLYESIAMFIDHESSSFMMSREPEFTRLGEPQHFDQGYKRAESFTNLILYDYMYVL